MCEGPWGSHALCTVPASPSPRPTRVPPTQPVCPRASSHWAGVAAPFTRATVKSGHSHCPPLLSSASGVRVLDTESLRHCGKLSWACGPDGGGLGFFPSLPAAASAPRPTSFSPRGGSSAPRLSAQRCKWGAFCEVPSWSLMSSSGKYKQQTPTGRSEDERREGTKVRESQSAELTVRAFEQTVLSAGVPDAVLRAVDANMSETDRSPRLPVLQFGDES